MASSKRTPFYPAHQAAGARFMDFGGWDMPVQFQGILAEHRAVRERAGLFDISHMGQLWVLGAGAEDFLQQLVTNDIAALPHGKGAYALLCREDGGVLDDLFVYRLETDRFLVIVNAGRTEVDMAWFRQRAAGMQVDLVLQDEAAGLALQGPLAEAVLKQTLPAATALKRNELGTFALPSGNVVIARTGYTGEDGFELFAPASSLLSLYPALLKEGITPCGLGARDTLRLEMGYRLYGNDLDEQHSAIEAGLGWAVKFDKGDFVGREPLLRQKTQGPARRLIGFRLLESGIPRHGHKVFLNDRQLGDATSGSFSPSLQIGIGLAYVDAVLFPKAAEKTSELQIEIHNRRVRAEACPLPFYRNTKAAPQP